MSARWFAKVVIVLSVAISWAVPTRAQCAEWDDRFHLGTPFDVFAACVYDDGSGPALYLGGSSGLARWDGTTLSHGALGQPNGYVTALAVYDDGSGPKLYAGGTFTAIGGVTTGRLAKWNGTSWSPGGPVDRVAAMVVFDDGSGAKLYVAELNCGCGLSPFVRSFDGTTWTILGLVNGSGVTSLAGYDDGSGPALYAAGEFSAIGGATASNVARWNGTAWSAVGGGTDTIVWSLGVHDDGNGPTLIAGGAFTVAGGIPAARIARWDGASWSPLGAGANAPVTALLSLDHGFGPELYAAGSMTSAGGVPVAGVARWNGAAWSAVGPTVPGAIDGTVGALAGFDAGSGPELYAAGAFDRIGGTVAPKIGRWDGAVWSAIGETGLGLDATATAVATFDDGSGEALYVGGHFDAAGHVPASGFARWDGATWTPLGAPFVGAAVNDLVPYDNGSGTLRLLGAGYLEAEGILGWRVARWTGAGWSTLGGPAGGMDSAVYVLAVFDDGDGPAVYAAGMFGNAGGVPASRIAKWDGVDWSALGGPGAGVNDQCVALAVHDDGSGPALYAAGAFTLAGGVSAPYVARWNGSAWSAVGAAGSGPSHNVLSLASFGGDLYAGGSFGGGGSLGWIARWDGTTWTTVGAPGTAPNAAVRALKTIDDGNGAALYASGDFTVPAPSVARWDGAAWSAIGAPGVGTNSSAFDFATFDDVGDGAPDLYLVGSFQSAGTKPSLGVARWKVCPPVPEAFCFGDGGAGACPCANFGLPGRGCDNSIASGGAALSSAGTSAPDAIVLTQQGELASSLSIFLQGTLALPNAVPFGDGLRCVGGTLKRLYVKTASGGTAIAPGAGDASITTRSAELGDPIAPGTTRHYQVYYRDPDLAFCPAPQGDGFNVGNALSIVW